MTGAPDVVAWGKVHLDALQEAVQRRQWTHLRLFQMNVKKLAGQMKVR